MEEVVEKALESIKGKPSGTNPTCLDLFDKLTVCGGSANQSRYYYRHGHFENCSVYWSDWVDCLHAKLTNDTEKKENLLCNMNYAKENREKHARKHIWKMKTVPSWTNNIDTANENEDITDLAVANNSSNGDLLASNIIDK